MPNFQWPHPIRAVLFDLDGTLIDSVPDIAVAVDNMLAQLQLPLAGEDYVHRWVGNGADRLLHRALTREMELTAPPELFQLAKPIFLAEYEANLYCKSRLYDGVETGLQQLQTAGLKLACVTNKPSQFAAPLLEKIGIGGFFETVVGGECTPHKKPHPASLLLAADRLQVPIEQCLMVGDSINDMGAAKNAHCPVICVPYGYHQDVDLIPHADGLISSIAELAALIANAQPSA